MSRDVFSLQMWMSVRKSYTTVISMRPAQTQRMVSYAPVSQDTLAMAAFALVGNLVNFVVISLIV